ncbi:unnamed protein product [Allacma fusca]|uniref:Uncharacterized protein n=1 Tax=Allacma fusca TaxID=39272 RepID=A0A8J2P8Y5_9HEXA|nr:unnamed protein product [Allacma fusca]
MRLQKTMWTLLWTGVALLAIHSQCTWSLPTRRDVDSNDNFYEDVSSESDGNPEMMEIRPSGVQFKTNSLLMVDDRNVFEAAAAEATTTSDCPDVKSTSLSFFNTNHLFISGSNPAKLFQLKLKKCGDMKLFLTSAMLLIIAFQAKSECCHGIGLNLFTRGYCGDGSVPTPCCGHGPCNMFCCACSKGCRKGIYFDSLQDNRHTSPRLISALSEDSSSEYATPSVL